MAVSGLVGICRPGHELPVRARILVEPRHRPGDWRMGLSFDQLMRSYDGFRQGGLCKLRLQNSENGRARPSLPCRPWQYSGNCRPEYRPRPRQQAESGGAPGCYPLRQLADRRP